MVYAQTIIQNEKYKILWDFVIQTDHLVLASTHGIDQEEKKTLLSSGIYHLGRPQSENKIK